MTASSSGAAPSSASTVRTRRALAPAAWTASSRRVAQIRSSARIATLAADRSAAEGTSGNPSREMPEDVPSRHHADRDLAAVDDRDMPEPTDRHLVDRNGDGIVMPEDDRVGGHHLPKR